MGLLGRWLSDAISMTGALAFAILAMQAPAFTHEYASALLQVSQDSQRDIEQRKASARQFYTIIAENDDQFIAALRRFEPSNAETLALSLGRERALHTAYERITGSRFLLQPFAALRDALDDPMGYKTAVWRTLLGTYNVQVSFSLAAAVYGFVGLLVGSLLAQLLLAACGKVGERLLGSRAQPVGRGLEDA